MRYISVCAGIEAASVAWHALGWNPVAFSEIEKFPSAVLAHHYPNVPNWGDMTKFKEWPNESIDILVGGTPCQSFSVAGLRKGLDDPRGNLMLTYLAIADRYRPEWLVWENVPGVLSSNKGRDFGTFLGALGELRYGFAYRVLDAQYFGVAQRRRRVFVVANARSWQRAAAVLFERESLSRNPAPSRKTGKVVTAGVDVGVDMCGPLNAKDNQHFDTDGLSRNSAKIIPVTVAGALGARTGLSIGVQDAECGHMIPVAFALQGAGATSQNSQGSTVNYEVCFTLNKTEVHGVAVTQCTTFQEIADCLTEGYGTKWSGNASATNGSLFVAQPMAVAYGVGESPNVAHCLRSSASRGNKHESTTYVAQPVAFDTTQITSPENRSNPKVGDPCHPLAAGAHPPLIAGMQVRRLTPRECERLQGFPDDYTLIPYRNKPACDGPRYKALGNSMAVPVMRWIGRRIDEVSKI